MTGRDREVVNITNAVSAAGSHRANNNKKGESRTKRE